MESIELYVTTYRRLREAKKMALQQKIQGLFVEYKSLYDIHISLYNLNPQIRYSIDFSIVQFVNISSLIQILEDLINEK